MHQQQLVLAALHFVDAASFIERERIVRPASFC